MDVHCASPASPMERLTPSLHLVQSAQCTHEANHSPRCSPRSQRRLLHWTTRLTALNNTYFVCIPLIRTYYTYIFYLVKIRGCQNFVLFVTLFYLLTKEEIYILHIYVHIICTYITTYYYYIYRNKGGKVGNRGKG